MYNLALFSEDDDRINFVFNGETLAFTLMLKKCIRHKSFEKIKTYFYCVWGRHHPSGRSIESDVNKTCQKILIGKSVPCNWKKKQWLLVITQKQLKVYVDFYEIQEEALLKLVTKLETNVKKNPGWALAIGAKKWQSSNT